MARWTWRLVPLLVVSGLVCLGSHVLAFLAYREVLRAVLASGVFPDGLPGWVFLWHRQFAGYLAALLGFLVLMATLVTHARRLARSQAEVSA